MIELIDRLVRIPGVSGFEGPVRKEISELVKEYGKLSVDGIGNLILDMGGSGQHIAFVAHMDEVGCVVSRIEENGAVKIRKISADDRSIAGRVYDIWTKKGPVHGVVGIKPPHLVSDPEEMKKVVPAEKLAIDVGARSRREAVAMGIDIFDPVLIKKELFVVNKKYISARALDNRVGCAILIESLKEIKEINPRCRLSFVWSVQEEIGLRGATVVANTLKPDIAFAIDTFSTTDCPDAPSHLTPVYLGKGPVLRMIDNRAIASAELRDAVVTIAARKKIPIQLGVTGGTTDGASLQECGCRMLPLGIPLRYTHSPTELAHIDDIKSLARLIPAIIKDIM